ncbi:DUF1488 domain-containing protein [Vibrio sp. Of14-4]|uniref:DUF1488 domain-containing protein n=1 Tax=Vibrio sp. Of14-4 TaxID=2724878 RepID=UPI001EF38BDF|nr:DUF1488 domain-containing protein [Vibrio sp. Of14-4]MCG7491316.1 DUF1488 domain-containing protein [Vibrio sp. Of14-4]
MNQSILFSDMQTWNEAKQVVLFPAQCCGALIQCQISKKALEKMSGCLLNDEQHILTVFSQFRFEIEELAEALIEDEAFDQTGMIEISN